MCTFGNIRSIHRSVQIVEASRDYKLAPDTAKAFQDRKVLSGALAPQVAAPTPSNHFRKFEKEA